VARCASWWNLLIRLEAPGARIELAFPFFVRKLAPVSGVASLLDYDVRLAADLVDGKYSHTITVAVPVTSLCPSSKEIAEYGAHNQRSIVTISARPSAHLFVGELLRIAEEEASASLRHPEAPTRMSAPTIRASSRTWFAVSRRVSPRRASTDSSRPEFRSSQSSAYARGSTGSNFLDLTAGCANDAAWRLHSRADVVRHALRMRARRRG
jgi:hypothetical protein